MPCSEDDDSQNGFAEPHQGMSKAELRKTNKPIMEKKRRARINNCLNELKDLLMDATDKDPARHSKLEKADILELTVKHLQTLQRQQLAAAIAADPAVLHRFKSGFGDCAVEVRRYLSRLASVPTGLRHRLGNHLSNCLSGMHRLNPPDYPPLVPDPLRLDDERPSAFHFVRSTRPNSPPLSPMSCDSACDSSTELETPPRPVQTFPFPTPPSRSASDQDSSPETQKPTVSSTTISPETLKQEALRNKKYMEPLSIVIDVENYKIGIDASPKRAVDYSMRHKLKRPVVEMTGPAPKLIKLEPEKPATTEADRKVIYAKTISPEKSAFTRVADLSRTALKVEKITERTASHPLKVVEHTVSVPEKKLTLPESILVPVDRKLTLPESILVPVDRKLTRPESIVVPVDRKLTLPESIVVPVERKFTLPETIVVPVERQMTPPRNIVVPGERQMLPENIVVPAERKSTFPQSIVVPVERQIPQRTVISHTAESLAQSSSKNVKVEVKVEADTSSRSPERTTAGSSNTEMWRPW